MKVKGIRITDSQGSVLDPTILSNILKKISNYKAFYWSILFLDGTPIPGQGKFLTDYENRINNSENGLLVKWEELIKLSRSFFQMFETTILGCKDRSSLRRYEKENEMYRTCDIVIDLIDCAFWEVYAKDRNLIDKLAKNFINIEILEI